MYWIKKNSLRFLVNQRFFNMLSPMIIIKVRRRVTTPSYCSMSCIFQLKNKPVRSIHQAMDSGSQSVVLVNSSTSHIIPATAVRVYKRANYFACPTIQVGIDHKSCWNFWGILNYSQQSTQNMLYRQRTLPRKYVQCYIRSMNLDYKSIFINL